MLPEPWRAVRRLLVVRLDNAGDVVLLSPALRALRAALPDAAITLLASPAGSQVAPLLPWVDDVLTHRAVWQDLAAGPPDPRQVESLVTTLRGAQFDAAVLFTSFSQSPYPPAMACYLAGIPLRLGQSALFGGGILSTCIQPPPDVYHQADRNLHLLAAAGFPIPDPHLALHVPNAVQAAADALLRRRGVDPAAPFILVAPGASCAARRYPPRRFAAALRLLAAQTPLPIVVTGSAREAAHVRAALPADPHGRFTSLLGDTSLPEAAAVIRRAAVVLANNSAPLHIADAFDRPQVILYAGTEYLSQWRPRRAPARLLRRPTTCTPCYRFECPYNQECLDVPPAEVAAAVLNLLAAAPPLAVHPPTARQEVPA